MRVQFRRSDGSIREVTVTPRDLLDAFERVSPTWAELHDFGHCACGCRESDAATIHDAMRYANEAERLYRQAESLARRAERLDLRAAYVARGCPECEACEGSGSDGGYPNGRETVYGPCEACDGSGYRVDLAPYCEEGCDDRLD
jgi:hypothetical protein